MKKTYFYIEIDPLPNSKCYKENFEGMRISAILTKN